MSVWESHPALILVYVNEAGQQGRYWVMCAEDALRMVTQYDCPIIDWALLDDFIEPALPPDW